MRDKTVRKNLQSMRMVVEKGRIGSKLPKIKPIHFTTYFPDGVSVVLHIILRVSQYASSEYSRHSTMAIGATILSRSGKGVTCFIDKF